MTVLKVEIVTDQLYLLSTCWEIWMFISAIFKGITF